jgi:hypothetical protein
LSIEIEMTNAPRDERRQDGIRGASCGKVFQPARRSDATTCSPACRQRMHRDRRDHRAKLCARIERLKQQTQDAERKLAALDRDAICDK